jgi:hypothetical protein
MAMGKMLVEHFHVEADALFGGEGVHVAANGVHLAGDIFGGAMLGAFENHVLDEVGDAVPGQIFVAGAALDPDADGDGADVLHLFGENGEPVGQNGALDVFGFANHRSSFDSDFDPEDGKHLRFRVRSYCYILPRDAWG